MEVTERRAVSSYRSTDENVARNLGRIMLRYRPIAPKPAAGRPTLGGVEQNSTFVGKEKRKKGTRRKARLTGGRRGRKSKKVETVVTARDGTCSGGTATLVPFPLKKWKQGDRAMESPTLSGAATSRGFWQAWEGSDAPGVPVARTVLAPRPVRVVAASVTVENVMESWGGEFCGSISGDGELRRWLDSDSSPAFVSDFEDKVIWTNAAYRTMVIGGSGLESRSSRSSSSPSSSSSSSSYNSSSCSGVKPLPETVAENDVRVALVTRSLLPSSAYRFFTCMARVRYACRRRGKVSLTSPCDVWRLADGSLAWRLDVKAALSL